MSQLALYLSPGLNNIRNVMSRHALHRSFSATNTFYKKTKTTSEEEQSKDEPIKYFGSPAARWKAEQTRSGQIESDMPWYQPYVVNLSVAVFLIYFCVLREENDIDRQLESSLYDQIPGLEEKQLLVNYKYNKENGLSTVEIEQRMKELGMEY